MYVRPRLKTLGVIFCLMAAVAAAHAEAMTKVELILSAETARPGDTVMAGIRLKMQPGWHTYWQNPGDSGIPTEIKWTLPPGITAGAIQWPVPEVLSEFGFVTYIYTNEVLLLVPLKIGATVPRGPVDIKALVSWQECSNICVTGQVDLAVSLEIGDESRPSFDAEAIRAAEKELPRTGANLVLSAHWETGTTNRPLVIEWATETKPAEVDFFSYANTNYQFGGEVERLPDQDGKIRIRKIVTNNNTAWPAKIDGLWVTKEKTNSPFKGYEVTLSPAAQVAAPAAADGAANTTLPVALGLAFLGGLLLNIMPCVLPVIALKILGFVSQAKESPGRVRALGLVYGMGVLTSFAVLAGLAITVQRAGGVFSWNTAFQNPQFRVIITTLITLVALNLFGVFEITLSSGAMTAATELTGKKGASGAFFNGVLATILATPCTAPFLASALVFIVGQPPLVIILVFLAAGLGLAMPYVVLCWHPAWLKFLPKPGLWMQRFKVAMGFPMLATAMWLFWLTATSMGDSGVVWLGLFLVGLAMAAWVWGEFAQRGTKHTGLAMFVSLALAGGAYGFILEHELHWRLPPGTVTEKDPIQWQPWSAEAVNAARDAGHPVLVDFTAKSCLNCQINKVRSIDVDDTRKKLKEMGAVTLIADYGNPNEAIAKELQRLGQGGIPVVAVYPADKSRPPIVIGGLFSKERMIEALDTVSKQQ